jgi:hypothetical protein
MGCLLIVCFEKRKQKELKKEINNVIKQCYNLTQRVEGTYQQNRIKVG